MHKERILVLDSIRGIAAVGVAVFWHYKHFGTSPPPLHSIFAWAYDTGWVLVDLFFVLSGMVFTYVYQEHIARRKTSLAEYGLWRFSRLYPLHLLTLLFVAIVQMVRVDAGSEYFIYRLDDAEHLIYNLLFFHCGFFESGYSFNGPSWSIAVEIACYLAFFTINRYAPGRRFMLYTAMICFGVVGVTSASVQWPFLNPEIGRGCIGFFVGCLLFESFKADVMRQQRLHLAIVLVGLAVAVAVSVRGQVFGRFLDHPLFIFPAFIILAMRSPLLNRALSCRPLAYLGDLSYSVYLMHFPIQLALVTIFASVSGGVVPYTNPAFLLFYLLTVIGLSIASFHFIEGPLMRLLRTRKGAFSGP